MIPKCPLRDAFLCFGMGEQRPFAMDFPPAIALFALVKLFRTEEPRWCLA